MVDISLFPSSCSILGIMFSQVITSVQKHLIESSPECRRFPPMDEQLTSSCSSSVMAMSIGFEAIKLPLFELNLNL